jgi:tetratricopeptide (TPR) repeat protein
MTVDTELDTLEAKGLVRVATYQPELEYLFRHALVQDAAYESLLKQERRALHHTVGEALERLYPERRGEMAAVLAMHFDQAGDTERALHYSMEAAKFALERNALVEAYTLYERAAAMLPPSSPTDDAGLRRLRIDIGLGAVKAGFTFRGLDEGVAALESLVDEAERLGDLRLLADVHLHLALMRQLHGGERPETSPALRRSLDRVTEIGEQLHDSSISALPKALVGTTQIFAGEIREGVTALEEAVPALRERHDFIGGAFALGIRAIGYARLGEFERAYAAAKEATDLAGEADVIAQLDALIAESTVRSLHGDLAGAAPLAQRCTAWSEEAGATACMVASNFVLGDVYLREGRFEDAKQALERGHEISAITGFSLFRPSIGAWLRTTAAYMGDFGPARDWEQELGDARSRGDRFSEASILAKRAETRAKALAEGSPLADIDAVAADFAASVSAFDAMGARPFAARTLRSWGEALRATERSDEGDEKLRRALMLFEEMGIDREAAEVKAELSGLPVTPLKLAD